MTVGNLGRRERLGLFVLAILAPVAGWQYLGPWLNDIANAGSSGFGRSRGIQERSLARKEIVDLRLELLEARSGEYEPGRNIFTYGKAPRPEPPPPKPVVRRPQPQPQVDPRPREDPRPRPRQWTSSWSGSSGRSAAASRC